MKKIQYLILSLSLCTGGIVTASYITPERLSLDSDQPVAVNDTIVTGEDDLEDEEDDDALFTDEEEEEFGEMHDDIDFGDDEAEEDDATSDAPAALNDSLGMGDLDLPEGMLLNTEDQLNDWNNSQYLTEGNRPSSPEDVDTQAETYKTRLQRIPAIMEMPYNDVVRKYIDQYTNRLRHSVSIMLGAQNFYVPMFEEALEAEGCPLELKYLPVIESAYNPTATSRVGAVGLWQFMITTGKQYGLEVNSLVDERRDPIKSSKAAARYLKHLYNQLGDWTLVIAAYNCGPKNVEKAIQRAGGTKDYWQIYPYLPHETRGYVPAFIAANYVMQYYCEHGIQPMQATLPAESDTVMIQQDLHLQQVADLCEVNIKELEALNPQYRQQIVPGTWKPCALRLPAGSVQKFIACSDSIYTYRADELLPRRALAAVNDNYSPVIRSGNGGIKSSRHGRASKKSRRKRGGGTSVTIRQGDTLGAIARRNGTTVAKLKRLNGISGSNIRAGKKIRVR